jgi:hypothetical protein
MGMEVEFERVHFSLFFVLLLLLLLFFTRLKNNKKFYNLQQKSFSFSFSLSFMLKYIFFSFFFPIIRLTQIEYVEILNAFSFILCLTLDEDIFPLQLVLFILIIHYENIFFLCFVLCFRINFRK